MEWDLDDAKEVEKGCFVLISKCSKCGYLSDAVYDVCPQCHRPYSALSKSRKSTDNARFGRNRKKYGFKVRKAIKCSQCKYFDMGCDILLDKEEYKPLKTKCYYGKRK